MFNWLFFFFFFLWSNKETEEEMFVRLWRGADRDGDSQFSVTRRRIPVNDVDEPSSLFVFDKSGIEWMRKRRFFCYWHLYSIARLRFNWMSYFGVRWMWMWSVVSKGWKGPIRFVRCDRQKLNSGWLVERGRGDVCEYKSVLFFFNPYSSFLFFSSLFSSLSFSPLTTVPFTLAPSFSFLNALCTFSPFLSLFCCKY
jgi:hypothetical protein